MKKTLLLLLVLVCAERGVAQVVNYDFFAFRTGNMFSVNPAWVTKDEGINIILNSQVMGSSLDYAQKNLMVGAYAHAGDNSGLGMKVISDSRGAFQTLHADLSYGFHARFTEGHSLRMGVLAGMNNSRLQINRLDSHELIDLSDPTLSSSYYNNTQFVAGAGVLYTLNNLDIAASLPQVVSTSRPLNSYVNAAVFYKIRANEEFTVQPWVSYQSMPVTKTLMGGYIKASYKDFLWAQAGYQNNKAVAGAVGAFYENIGFSYGFRLANPEFKEAVGGAVHEIAFTIRIDKKKSKKTKQPGEDATGLEDVLARLDRILNEDVTSNNAADLREELNTIKQMLAKAEIDNASPGKTKLVQEQLIVIEDKIRAIEAKLK